MILKLLMVLSVIMLQLIKYSASQQPYTPFDGFSKCFIAANKCPNKNVTFHLYTSKSPKKPHELKVNELNTIKHAKFILKRPLIVLLHGYTGDKDYSPNGEIRPAYLNNGDYNIISVDYHPLALEPCYLQAVQNLPVVANCTAQLLDMIISINAFKLDDIHIIGFSLGAQTAGMVANFIKAGKLKRITGLDPAKPLFIFATGDHKLDKNDAEFVDVIHTDVFQRGMLSSIGHADFYANGGIEQPGCKLQNYTSPGSCNHIRAPRYYAESISSEIGFWGFRCKEWVYWALGLCRPSTSDQLAIMGMRASKDARGMFFLNTNKYPPFAIGILPEFQPLISESLEYVKNKTKLN